MTSAELAGLIRVATADAVTGHGIDAARVPADIDWAPRRASRGDFASTVALRAAAALDLAPRELAGWLATELARRSEISSVEVAGPGFVNFRLAGAARGAVVGAILAAGDAYGRPPGAFPAWTGGAAGADGADQARYAHARMCALARHAAALGVSEGDRYELLDHPLELALLAGLAEFGEVTRRLDPARLARHLARLAEDVQRVEPECPALPKGDEPTNEVHRARVALGAAARQALANGLRLLGVSAPERM